MDKILPILIDGKNQPGKISFGLFLEILSELMSSASAFKWGTSIFTISFRILGNTSSKMKMILQRPEK